MRSLLEKIVAVIFLIAVCMDSMVDSISKDDTRFHLVPFFL